MGCLDYRCLDYRSQVSRHCLCRVSLVWYKQSELRIVPLMHPSEHFEMRRRQNWCALVVLVAICFLTVHLVTRYYSAVDSSTSSVTTVAKHSSRAGHRQRLDKDAELWIAPVLCSAALPAPRSYPRIARAVPPIPHLLFAEALYNRPPPSPEFFV